MKIKTLLLTVLAFNVYADENVYRTIKLLKDAQNHEIVMVKDSDGIKLYSEFPIKSNKVLDSIILKHEDFENLKTILEL